MTPRHCFSAAIIAGVVAAIAGIFNPVALLGAWHFAVVCCIQIALGSLFVTLLFQTTGGRWGERILPALSVGNRLVIPSLAALLPVIIFLPTLYRWHDVGDRTLYLNHPFFAVRWVIYLVVFGMLSILIGRGHRPAAGGLILFAMTAYFLAIDLVMALSPDWYSSGFPVVFMASGSVMGLALAIAVRASSPLAPDDTKAWRDLGGLLMAMVVFWSYVSFTQFLIIWMGNLPKEIMWYKIRAAAGWRWVTVFVAVFNLFVPFFLLLSRAIKDRPDRLRLVALAVLGCQVVYLYWLIAPSLPGRGFGGLHWLDPLVLVAVGAGFTGMVLIKWNQEKGKNP